MRFITLTLTDDTKVMDGYDSCFDVAVHRICTMQGFDGGTYVCIDGWDRPVDVAEPKERIKELIREAVDL